MTQCPCCSSQLLQHARQNRVYWFCPYCRQEMPDLSAMITGRSTHINQFERLMDTLVTR